MRLTFERGYFILSGVDKSAVDDWEKIDSDTFRTNSLRVAKRFRRRADKKAEAVFTKAFLQRYDVPTLPRLDFLDPHQLDGVRWILSRSRSYLAHAPGAGKTFQAIVAAYLCRGTGPVLFVVPPALTANWEREIYRASVRMPDALIPYTATVPTSGRKQTMDWRAEFLICPDSMLDRDWVLTGLIKARPRFIAVDEASRFKDYEAKRSVALFGGRKKSFKSPGLIYGPRHVVLMDGSPMPNRPMELWAPTYAMAPDVIDCMSRHEFGLRYCGATVNDWGAWEYKYASNEAELKENLTADFMHVVTEDELKHPERRRSILLMTKDPRTPEMRAFEKSELSKINFNNVDESASKGDLATYRRELGIQKAAWVSDYVASRLRGKNESILLFAWHREVAHALAANLEEFRPGVVIGGTDEDKREGYFKDFQAGRRRLIIGNIAAMGRGHNLQRADRIIFAEYSWTDELNKQCEKRASRRGSEKDFVRCEYIVAPNSLDERVLNAVFTKARYVKKIVG
jgi:SWI/SNF-related matrix-associated actin-dependent regulator 1 of chromatin subfamily A